MGLENRDPRTAVLSVYAVPLPDGALLARHAGGGAYTDCYRTEMARTVSLADFIAAFYTTWLFRLERRILSIALDRPSTDAEAGELARGKREAFAARTVEAREADQILLCDLHGRTRSWLQVRPAEDSVTPATTLLFGSAVLPRPAGDADKPSLGFVYEALLPFHRVYSRALLGAARTALGRGRHAGPGLPM